MKLCFTAIACVFLCAVLYVEHYKIDQKCTILKNSENSGAAVLPLKMIAKLPKAAFTVYTTHVTCHNHLRYEDIVTLLPYIYSNLEK